MPRRPKPFFHRGWWGTNVGSSRTKLPQGSENKDVAEDALLDLLNERRHHPDRKIYPQLTVLDLCEKFLDWAELHRSHDTYDNYRDWLNRWQKLHGTKRAQFILTVNARRRPSLSQEQKQAVIAGYLQGDPETGVSFRFQAEKAGLGVGTYLVLAGELLRAGRRTSGIHHVPMIAGRHGADGVAPSGGSEYLRAAPRTIDQG
jgi:hypothetical protein